MINQNDLKKKAALAALKYVGQNSIIGVGTGSTTNYFIDALATLKDQIEGAVASSIETEKRLRAHGINVIELNSVSTISVYIDGADEANETGYLIKGGGGAMTREKIVASASQQFVCIIDISKKVPFLGANMP
ncbi:MAG: ribose 5-phosphate isomerase A, partial [Rickettsiaceae bacterium]|nr:ribose 5-phosphate isomerase A [Rickettsiaceae bacterium]